jgi:hypothetical protein
MFYGSIITSGGVVKAGDGILEVVPGGTITVTYDDANDGTGKPAVVTDKATMFKVDHYTFSTIINPETAGVAFSETVDAYDSSDNLITGYNGTATLTASGEGGALSVTPTSMTFVSGVWTGDVTVNAVDPMVTLHVGNGLGAIGASNLFATQAGPLASFLWSTIASPEYENVPLPVTLTAKDANGYTATGFSGTANLTGLVGTTSSQTILGQPAYTDQNNNGAYTVGYSFTPRGNFLVTDILHFFGTKLSIWTSSGQLLMSQTFSGTNGSWVDTPMTTPYQLQAGTTYVITVYTAGQEYYWKDEMPPASPVGTIGNDYEVGGDGFPTYNDDPQQWLLDLQGDFETYSSVPIAPTTASFVNGVWTGNVTVTQAAGAMHLHVDDGSGHIGDSNTFDTLDAVQVIVTAPSDATEGDGTLSGTISVPVAPSADLLVNLASSDSTRVTVPASMTIPAGQTSVALPITVIDDTLLNGPEAIVITATPTAIGYAPGTKTINLHDNETATLTLSVPAIALEGAGVLEDAGTIVSSAAPSKDIAVELTSTNTTEVLAPTTVILPAGQTSVSFNLAIGDDYTVDGTQTVTLTAHVDN